MPLIWQSPCCWSTWAVILQSFVFQTSYCKTAFGDQDGRIGAHWVHALLWTHQKYIYMQRKSHRKWTADWWKDSSITKAIKKIHIELGRKGVDVIKFGTCAPRRRHRRRGYHRLRELPWGVRGLNNMLGTPALRSDRGKMNPYSWFENLWDLQRGCEKLMLLLKRTHTLAYFWEQGK